MFKIQVKWERIINIASLKIYKTLGSNTGNIYGKFNVNVSKQNLGHCRFKTLQAYTENASSLNKHRFIKRINIQLD
jgi:hypothetical protein